MKEKILNDFKDSHPLYSAFLNKCEITINELLNLHNIKVHQVVGRVKTIDSLEKKIDIKKDKYESISDITDICGLRIITYLESDVDNVAKIIGTEFDVDIENSIDKRRLNSDQFGYKSLHYVVKFSQQRLELSENKKYSENKIEIQVRSILQHAWASIEHDLGYKGSISIPDDFKRNFNRLAALLEVADIEFDRLKNDLSEYETKIKSEIKEFPDRVTINQASLYAFMDSNSTFHIASDIIQQNTGCDFFMKDDLIVELERFELFEINTIGKLNELIEHHQTTYLKFVSNFSKDLFESRLPFELPIFYFLHYLACAKESVDFLNNYFNYGSKRLGGKMTAEEFLEIYHKSI